MICPKCGYVFEPLDATCARCGWNPAGQPEPQPAAVTAPAAPANPPPGPAAPKPPTEFGLGLELDDSPAAAPVPVDDAPAPPPPIPDGSVVPAPPPPLPDASRTVEAPIDDSKLREQRRRATVGFSVGVASVFLGLIVFVAVILVFAVRTYLRMLHEVGL